MTIEIRLQRLETSVEMLRQAGELNAKAGKTLCDLTKQGFVLTAIALENIERIPGFTLTEEQQQRVLAAQEAIAKAVAALEGDLLG